MNPRRCVLTVLVVALLGGALALTGCNLRIYGGPYDPYDGIETLQDETLLVVTRPGARQSFTPGASVRITWEGSIEADHVTIDLYRHDTYLMPIDSGTENDGEFVWTVPPDFDAVTEDYNRYRIAVRAQHPDHYPGELYVQALSEEFAIEPVPTGGLTDVTVTQRLITITVTDNGSEIDGDTVDIVLNGSSVVAGHVLAAPPGTNFNLTLAAGPNLLEIIALNEGAVTPNTAELAISNVIDGNAVQEWRLATGETGALTITAP
jgi:archaellum component FlaF (FlaF/FlaG flagellin family)